MQCETQQSTETFRVKMIKDGVITLSDGSTYEIPHYNDPDYTTFFFVRHCEKVQDGTTDPDLTAEGRARAAKLGRVMEHAGLDQIVTTQYKRTKQTGEAVQERSAGTPLMNVQAEAQEAWLAAILIQRHGEQFLNVGHQNSVPFLLNKLVGKMQYQNIPDTEYGRLYIAVTKGGRNTEILEFQY
jgi:phosphohistidine phosphatase SixA